MIVGMGVNWTTVLVTGIPAIIGAILAGVATIIAAMNHRNLKMSNGASIAQGVEATHAVVTATSDAVDKINGTTGG